ncbi:MAG: dihydrodipicolinate synthase family protein, partial [Candidatus Hydrogenedentes bacterium]|nr:dihydrodipicolinate synthase family protein [Candidatus Hydrogenedentota bacterium]
MKELLDLHGIITVLNTPFLDDDSLDLEGLRRNVRYAIDAGVAGFLVPAMASEVGKLSETERLTLVGTV